VADGPIFDIGGYLDTGEEPGSGGPRRVVSSGAGTVAVGAVCNATGLDCRPAFWSNENGSTWDRVVVDAPNTTASDIAATEQGFVAVGSAGNPGGCGTKLPCAAVAFTSTDGATWKRSGVKVPKGFGVPDAFTDVVAVDGRFIAIAHELDGLERAPSAEPAIDDNGTRLWSSADGLTWTAIAGIPTDFGPSPNQPMAAGAGHVVIVGDLYARIAVSPKD
jgi:hypothetical protein